MSTTTRTVHVVHRVRGTRSGWEAITAAVVPTTHTIGLRETPEEVIAIVERMMEVGMMAESTVVVVPEGERISVQSGRMTVLV